MSSMFYKLDENHNIEGDVSPYRGVEAAMRKIFLGRKYRFDYPRAFVTLQGYTDHNGQIVTVVRRLTKTESSQDIERMYEVVAADGWRGHAWISELVDVK